MSYIENRWQKKVDEINSEINDLEDHVLNVEQSLQETNDIYIKYEKRWDLKELYGKLREKYRSLEIWSDEEYPNEKNKQLGLEIYYYESCLSMLKGKYGPSKIDLRHFLNLVQLEYTYFFENNNVITQKYYDERFPLTGYCRDDKLNLLINNLENAQRNLTSILQHYNNEGTHKELFIYYELMGDLIIHTFALLKKFEPDQTKRLDYYLYRVYLYYKISVWHKISLEFQEPTVYHDGLHGWPCLGLYIQFYNDLGVSNVNDVKQKLESLEKYYPLSHTENKKLEIEVKKAIDEFQ